MSTAWSLFVIILTAVNILAAWWLLRWTSRTSPDEAETTGHVWDGDLREYNNPLPRWWLILFYLTVVFAVGYLLLYPGMGNFKGLLGWSQESEYKSNVAAVEARYADYYAQFEGKDIPALAQDETALKTGRNLFVHHCRTCHGSDAGGARGFPNLRDQDWLWGGHPAAIEASILNGRAGVMPALGAALGEAGVTEVATYVRTLSGRAASTEQAEAGKAKFAMFCAACHGPEGGGNQPLGAPNLRDDIWLYGDSLEEIQYGIMNGRQNRMPPHADLLGEDRARIVAAYVYSLSNPDGVSTASPPWPEP